MKKMIFSLIAFISITVFGNPADSTGGKISVNKNPHPIKRFYVATGAELIFSSGILESDSLPFESKWRFSIFPHVQQQYHFNFNKAIGFYTGFSIINLGIKNTMVVNDISFELRQRSMSFGIPLALKLGSMKNGNFIALGASAECMFHYKYKLYEDNKKTKFSDWMDPRVNLFNYALFIDLRNKTGGYIRFKYYMDNFLSTVSQDFVSPVSQTPISFTPTTSSIFYISVGSTFMKKKPRKLTLDDV